MIFAWSEPESLCPKRKTTIKNQNSRAYQSAKSHGNRLKMIDFGTLKTKKATSIWVTSTQKM